MDPAGGRGPEQPEEGEGVGRKGHTGVRRWNPVVRAPLVAKARRDVLTVTIPRWSIGLRVRLVAGGQNELAHGPGDRPRAARSASCAARAPPGHGPVAAERKRGGERARARGSREGSTRGGEHRSCLHGPEHGPESSAAPSGVSLFPGGEGSQSAFRPQTSVAVAFRPSGSMRSVSDRPRHGRSGGGGPEIAPTKRDATDDRADTAMDVGPIILPTGKVGGGGGSGVRFGPARRE